MTAIDFSNKLALALADGNTATIGAADAMPVLIEAYGEERAKEIQTVARLQYGKDVVKAALAKLGLLDDEPQTEPEQEEPTPSRTKAKRRPRSGEQE